MMAETVRQLVSVKFDDVGRTRRFLLPEAGFEPPPVQGDDVICMTGRQLAYGRVTRAIPAVDRRREAADPVREAVVRRASRQDVTERLKQQHVEREARRVAALKIKERGLGMKLVRVEHQFDGPRLVFSYTAEARVDFRALVRELAAEFRCRIVMRQIGPRDAAQILGGYGTCGRPLCCTTWLPRFEPITIRMAKQQRLVLNPSRLSGLCGRLKCCLRYELPNAAGESFAGCAHENSCSRSGNSCGSSGGCTAGGCRSCSSCG